MSSAADPIENAKSAAPTISTTAQAAPPKGAGKAAGKQASAAQSSVQGQVHGVAQALPPQAPSKLPGQPTKVYKEDGGSRETTQDGNQDLDAAYNDELGADGDDDADLNVYVPSEEILVGRRKWKVKKDKKLSLNGQIVNMPAGAVLEEHSGYAPEAIEHMRVQGLELEELTSAADIS